MRPSLLPLAMLSCLLACNQGTFYSVAPTVSPTATLGPLPAGPLLFYRAYGDSIAEGAMLSSQSQAYPALVSQATGLPVTIPARNGDQACDVPTSQIFAGAESPSTAQPGLYTLLISTNDVDVKHAGAYEAIFNLCHQASIAWLAVPVEFKVLGNSTHVTATGPTHIDTTYHWNSIVLDAPGTTASFPFQLASSGPVYIWYRIQDGLAGSFQYQLDGVSLGSATTATQPAIATQNLGTNSLALLRLPVVPAGTHTLTFLQTSGGLNGAGIVAVGVPPQGTIAGLPRVIVGTTPLQLKGSNALCASDQTPCLAYIADITANVKLLAGDGLHVTLFDSRTYMTGTYADMADTVHPNAVGHQEIFHAIYTAYPINP